jgi:hypothetical protein
MSYYCQEKKNIKLLSYTILILSIDALKISNETLKVDKRKRKKLKEMLTLSYLLLMNCAKSSADSFIM